MTTAVRSRIRSSSNPSHDYYSSNSSGDPTFGQDLRSLVELERNAAYHHSSPISCRYETPEDKFTRLTTDWLKRTMFTSSATQIIMDPSYQQIIGMGPVALPFILARLKQAPGHWHWALSAITGEDPTRSSHAGHIEKMRKAWLDWGRTRGLI